MTQVLSPRFPASFLYGDPTANCPHFKSLPHSSLLSAKRFMFILSLCPWQGLTYGRNVQLLSPANVLKGRAQSCPLSPHTNTAVWTTTCHPLSSLFDFLHLVIQRACNISKKPPLHKNFWEDDSKATSFAHIAQTPESFQTSVTACCFQQKGGSLNLLSPICKMIISGISFKSILSHCTLPAVHHNSTFFPLRHRIFFSLQGRRKIPSQNQSAQTGHVWPQLHVPIKSWLPGAVQVFRS